MNSTPPQSPTENECRRLQQQVERDGGTNKLSQTDLAFFQTFCHGGKQDLPPVQDAGLATGGGIDESAHIAESTSFGDPNAGRPDDPADANPAAPRPVTPK